MAARSAPAAPPLVPQAAAHAALVLVVHVVEALVVQMEAPVVLTEVHAEALAVGVVERGKLLNEQ